MGTRHVFVGESQWAELDAVKQFLIHADRLGIPTPLDYEALKADLGQMIQLLNVNVYDEEPTLPSPEVLKQGFPSSTLYPAFALAQHHGVPTRFLDWTESPLVAAYFAARGASTALRSSGSPDPARADRFGIFAINIEWAENAGISVIQGVRAQNSFERVQLGMFTIINRADALFLDTGHWPAIEDMYRSDRSPPLDLYSLPASEADELLRILHSHNITQHHLMPSLENAAQAAKYTLSLFRHAVPKRLQRPLSPPH